MRRRSAIHLSFTALWFICAVGMAVVATRAAALQASPAVLYDSGTAVSVTPWMQKAQLMPPPVANLPGAMQRSLAEQQRQLAMAAQADQFDDVFPVRSPGLSPGKVINRDIDGVALERPVCVVGADPLSRQWLARVAPLLKRANAVCLAVNIDSAAQFAQLRASIPGIVLQPVAGDDVMSQLQIRHYPVVISQTMIEQ